jgi:hypothetical protein
MTDPVRCQICHKPVMLETARTDEHGNAVHEECYVRAVETRKVSDDSSDSGAVA